MTHYKPGEVTSDGSIMLDDGALLHSGMVWTNFIQALKAYRFGWNIVAAVANSKGTYFAIRRM